MAQKNGKNVRSEERAVRPAEFGEEGTKVRVDQTKKNTGQKKEIR